MTPEELAKLSPVEKLARQVAITAPMNQAKYSRSANIPWELIHDLRRALEAEGFDWVSGRRIYLQIRSGKVKPQ